MQRVDLGLEIRPVGLPGGRAGIRPDGQLPAPRRFDDIRLFHQKVFSFLYEIVLFTASRSTAFIFIQQVQNLPGRLLNIQVRSFDFHRFHLLI